MDKKYAGKNQNCIRYVIACSRVKTSGEGSTEIAILVIRVPSVDIRTVGTGIADVHEVTIGVLSFPYLRAFCGINGTECNDTSGTICMIMWREIPRTRRHSSRSAPLGEISSLILFLAKRIRECIYMSREKYKQNALPSKGKGLLALPEVGQIKSSRYKNQRCKFTEKDCGRRKHRDRHAGKSGTIRGHPHRGNRHRRRTRGHQRSSEPKSMYDLLEA